MLEEDIEKIALEGVQDTFNEDTEENVIGEGVVENVYEENN